ncbi:hypothetical protein [Roseobacter weihaiensis]|uniref:hypothetical protein n=1 Tax=Roseobacter weihaiensis TaxID=2763262 RepID=UPI001D0B5A27|nr:hypothetical protein [Roseobacter sp. H9]
MTAAHIYFALMILAMLPLAVVHMLCREVVARYPAIMPDTRQRNRYRWAELAMGVTCLAMLWYMWVILDYMVTFCATTPVLGMIAHLPWIIGSFAVLVAKTRHLGRLVEQVKAL